MKQQQRYRWSFEPRQAANRAQTKGHSKTAGDSLEDAVGFQGFSTRTLVSGVRSAAKPVAENGRLRKELAETNMKRDICKKD
jgi:hypothetical protein